MSFLDSVGDFVGNNLGAIAGIGGLIGAYNNNSARDDYISALQGQEAYNYNQAQANHDAYSNYLGQYYAHGNAAAGAANAATAAFRDAFYASEAERLKQTKKGKKQLRRHHKKALNFLQPYNAAGLTVLPQHTKSYTDASNALGLMNAYLQSPEQMAKLNQDMPILEGGARRMPQLPEHMRGK